MVVKLHWMTVTASVPLDDAVSHGRALYDAHLFRFAHFTFLSPFILWTMDFLRRLSMHLKFGHGGNHDPKELTLMPSVLATAQSGFRAHRHLIDGISLISAAPVVLDTLRPTRGQLRLQTERLR
jgi:hypothetical protein